ncbi:hypothetical protein RJ640_028485 [Escallonia rubra]|uniref:Angio-associated migratory cell protein n=1 Tax=Escallonia rubra TaxID=112253 RepID=A0AA88UJW0_9ASTE|nr:hypothetical protein RJ640_028485 [Escallonia rubra]
MNNSTSNDEDQGGEVFLDENDEEEPDDSMHIFTGHTGELYTVSCSPTDAALVATGGGDDKGFLWKIGHGDWAFELQDILAGHKDSVSSLAFSKDGQLLACGGFDGLIQVWDIFSGNLKCTLEGRTICTGSDDASLRIWNPKNGENIHVVSGMFGLPFLIARAVCYMLICLSPCSYWIKGSSVRVVNITTGQVVSSLRAHSDSIECIGLAVRMGSWLGASRYLATGCIDGKVRIWDSLSGDCVRTFSGHSDAIQSISMSANGKFLVSVSIDGPPEYLRLQNLDKE